MNTIACEAFLKRKGCPNISVNKDGFNELTHDYIVAWCEWNDQYSLPTLVNHLYLNYKGKCL